MSPPKSAAGRRREQAKESDERARKVLVWPVLFLLLVGLAASVYLFHLFIRVRTAGPGEVDSFCALSDTLNCVTVANSTYSVFLGLPIALYGLEYYSLLSLIVLLAALSRSAVRAWDSLVFDGALLSLPACAVLAWISAYLIHSFCLLCMVVYGTNLLLVLILGTVHRRRLGQLILEGPRELLSRPGWLIAAIALLLLLASQLLWVPPRLRFAKHGPSSGMWTQLPVSGLTIGPVGAPVQVEEFTDFQCPHCGNAHTIMMEVLRRFPGKVRLVHRDYPLDMACNPKVKRPFHPYACQAAYYARCAAHQGKYWPYEELLFGNRDQLTEDDLRAYAERVGMNLDELARCVRDPATQQAVLDDIHEGDKRGITGTPTLFLNGKKMVGMEPLPWWEAKIKELSQ